MEDRGFPVKCHPRYPLLHVWASTLLGGEG